MVVGFTTTCAISGYDHFSCEFKSCSRPYVLDTTLCDIVCQWFATGWGFSLGTPISSTNKTDRHDITEILLKVALNTINQAERTDILNKIDVNTINIKPYIAFLVIITSGKSP